MLNLDNIQKNAVLIVNEQINVNFVALKTIVPTILGTAILGGLKQLAKDKSCEIVREFSVNTLNYSSMIFLVGGCLAFARGLDHYYASINPNRVEYLKLPKQDFEAMQKEIVYLRDRIEKQNSKLVS